VVRQGKQLGELEWADTERKKGLATMARNAKTTTSVCCIHQPRGGKRRGVQMEIRGDVLGPKRIKRRGPRNPSRSGAPREASKKNSMKKGLEGVTP